MQNLINFNDFDKICRFCLNTTINNSENGIDLIEITNNTIYFMTTAETNKDIIEKSTNNDNGNSNPQEHQEMQSIVLALQEQHQEQFTKIESANILNIIFKITDLEINPNDNLPKSMCPECLLKIRNIYEFRQRCIDSTNVLEKILLDVQGKPSNNSKNPDIIKSESNIIEDLIFKSEEPQQQQQQQQEQQHLQQNKDQIILIEINEIDLKTDTSTVELETTEVTKQPLNYDDDDDDDEKKNEYGLITAIDNNSNEKKEYTHDNAKLHNFSNREYKMCPICGDLRKGLHAHMLTHTNARPFKCDLCGRQVKSAASLRRHLHYHKEERPHHCQICEQTFKTPQTLKRHQLTHIDERNYACNYCKKTFKQSNSRDAHHLTHTQERKFKCEFCSKAFISIGGLRCHIGIHTGERRYKCGICPLTFKNTSSAAVHRRIHLEPDKQYKCEHCNMKFAFINLYKGHMQNYHELFMINKNNNNNNNNNNNTNTNDNQI